MANKAIEVYLQYLDGEFSAENRLISVIFFSKNIDLIQSDNNSSKKIICRIISTTCNPVTLGLKKFPMTISVGDLIVFNNCGAYTNSMSNNFHAYEKPKILFEE